MQSLSQLPLQGCTIAFGPGESQGFQKFVSPIVVVFASFFVTGEGFRQPKLGLCKIVFQSIVYSQAIHEMPNKRQTNTAALSFADNKRPQVDDVPKAL